MNTKFYVIAAVLTTWLGFAGHWACGGEGESIFAQQIRPLLSEFCMDCHSTENQKGDLDLERFSSLESVRKEPGIWQLVHEQLDFDEMPPRDKPQPATGQQTELQQWIRSMLGEVARAQAGDPGPVVLRRLSNAEYTYSIRDLTGLEYLEPAAEFPVDGAAGEGFTNSGAALVMSPALLSKYLDAAKALSNHMMLLPDGIEFSKHTSSRDWTEEKLAAIRAFYDRFTERGGGTSVNLQGIKFDTKDGGVLPLEKYFVATLAERETLRAGTSTLADVARDYGLNPKYLSTLWSALTDTNASLLLDDIRAQWGRTKPLEASELVAVIQQWQRALWRFTTVGHIGKRDGPKAWQEPVDPLASSREFRLKLSPTSEDDDVTLYLITSDAGDGSDNDVAVWKQPRLLVPHLPAIPLSQVGGLAAGTSALIASELPKTSQYLQVIADAHTAGKSVEQAAEKLGLNPGLAANWASVVGLGDTARPRATGHFTERLSNVGGVPEIRGWGAIQTPSLIANSADKPIQISTLTVPGRGVAVHPSPTHEAVVFWRSPIEGLVRIEGAVSDADGNCGNGVAWRVEWLGGGGVGALVDGAFDNGASSAFKLEQEISVRIGDMLKFSVNPREGNHACDTTYIELKVMEIGEPGRRWDMAQDLVDRVHDSNPLADSYGHDGVWHFCGIPTSGNTPSVMPPDSILALWRAGVINRTPDNDDFIQKVQGLLSDPDSTLPISDADKRLRRTMLDWKGPLGWLKLAMGKSVVLNELETQAPSVKIFRVPSQLAIGSEFVVSGALHSEKGMEGSIQMEVSLSKPEIDVALKPGALREPKAKSTWTDGNRASVSDAPILVAENSNARRRLIEEFAVFRELFPAALCYTKIVPVDEVVTLTLYYREDGPLRRLMLDEKQVAELDRLWEELHFVSEDALKLVDAFEQLWQYATQDADPSAFTPMREPILQRAAAFRQKLVASESAQVEAVLAFAARAWRRPLEASEESDLRELYTKLRAEELPHPDAIRLTLARVLVAPAFLYKLEKPMPGKEATSVSDRELATRLSYFLWSTTPDPELSALAEAGKLSEPDVLAAQTRRLVRDPRVRRLAVEFACQWMGTRDFDKLDEKSDRHFPEFKGLRAAMHEEPVRFFTDFFQRDRSILEWLDADHTFMNVTLADHYGFSTLDTADNDWRKFDGVRARGRGGVLGFGAVLAKQSGASRTSPILRGAWISEMLLGEHLPRPPKGIPVLPEETPSGLSERELTERHLNDPSCARCHNRIDPFGYALEHYDAIGRFREEDLAGRPINAHAKIVDGTEFRGMDGLRRYLLKERREDFVHQFCRKLLGYALGRAVQLSDEPLLEDIQSKLAASDYRVSVALAMIVNSPQFRQIRGRDFAASEPATNQ